MASNSLRIPPDPSAAKDFVSWKRDIEMWSQLTDVPKPKQGLAVMYATQHNKRTHEILCELTNDEVVCDGGLKKVIDKLETIYIKDKAEASYEAYESFESLRRKDDETIGEFVERFQCALRRTKSYGTVMSDDLLAYRLIKSASLSDTQTHLVRASAQTLTLDHVITAVKKIFGNSPVSENNTETVQIKTENLHFTEHYANDYDNPYSYTVPNPDPNSDPSEDLYDPTLAQAQGYVSPPGHQLGGTPEQSETEDIWYTQYRYNPRYSRFPIRRPAAASRGYFPNISRRPNFNRINNNNNSRIIRNKNPNNQFGQPSRCSICQSVMHWAKDCPHRTESQENTFYQVVLFQSDLEHPNALPSLVHESLSSGILDCGASKTCCGITWFNHYLESLNSDEQNKIRYYPSNSQYKFGDGKTTVAMKGAEIPIWLGSKELTLQTDIVDKDIPLLLSKKFMKQYHCQLCTITDTVNILGENINLINTQSGHYGIPITKKRQLINSIDEDRSQLVFLATEPIQDRKKIARKIHKQFGHPSVEKLIKLIKQSTLGNDKLLFEEIRKISEECEVCLRYKRTPPKPAVSLPLSNEFNQCVAMDIKTYKGVPLLHLIDTCTRFSMSSILKNKAAETIIEAIYKLWISIFGAPDMFLSDNGTEFANQHFRQLGEAYNIRVCTTAAESPFSNGICEKYNHVISEILDKIIYDTGCKLSIALPWAVNAKNSLQTVHGFSPSQLVLGVNPRLPTIYENRPPALSETKYTEIIEQNLKAMRTARTAFIQSESSERIRRALNAKIRTSNDVKYITGDTIYYKRKDDKCWHGPAKVIGQDGQCILVKHQSTWIRVHPCRIIHAKKAHMQVEEETKEENLNSTGSDPRPYPLETNENDNMLPLLNPYNDLDVAEFPEIQNNAPIEDLPDAPTNPEEPTNEPLHAERLPETSNAEATQPEINPEVPENEDNDEFNEQKYTIKKGSSIELKLKNDPENRWMKATVISRSGKANKKGHKNKYANEWNLNFEGEIKPIDFDTQVEEVRPYTQELEQEILFSEEYESFQEKEILKAKLKELDVWKKQQVYQEIPYNNQNLISLKWVVRPKIIEKIPSYKARLVCKGYQDLAEVRKDSPACLREGVRIALAVMSTSKWKVRSIDVRCAFLQGEPIERNVYVVPPKEANTSNIWQLKKTIYGLRDASRAWYMKIRKELIKLQCHETLDKGLFFWKNEEILHGIICLFVDDVLLGGSKLFHTTVIENLMKTFEFGSENETAFTYIGIEIQQNQDYSININQTTYAKSLKPIEIAESKQPTESVTNEIHKDYRSLVGSLNWIATITRPDIAFSVCSASTKVNSPTQGDVQEVNKILKYLKYHESILKIPSFDSLVKISLLVYSDASLANLPSGHSQGAYIIFFTDGYHACPISWSSHKLKRIVTSSLAAETLAFLEACDAAFYIAGIISPITHNGAKINIDIVSDCRSLVTAAATSKVIDDKRLRIEMNAVRELIDTKAVTIAWSSTKLMLADRLTKTAASPLMLLKALSSGRL